MSNNINNLNSSALQGPIKSIRDPFTSRGALYFEYKRNKDEKHNQRIYLAYNIIIETYQNNIIIDFQIKSIISRILELKASQWQITVSSIQYESHKVYLNCVLTQLDHSIQSIMANFMKLSSKAIYAYLTQTKRFVVNNSLIWKKSYSICTKDEGN